MPLSVLRPLGWVTAGLAGAATAVAVGHRPAPAPASPAAPTPRAVSATEADGPRVEPGLVRWHPTFADAQAASRASGKPVLLVHLMGRLDRQFC